jgi:O-antigen/teichoic acid export membrane protein
MSGIVTSLILLALSQMLITTGYSYSVYPLKLTLRRDFMSEGTPIVRLGVAFVLSGILGSGADLLIRSFLSREASLEMIGLYTASYMLMMTYAGVAFSAMESDFFPRLSAVNNNVEESNLTINRQIEVAFLLVSPMLVAFLVAVPMLLPLLYSSKFMAAISMTKIFVFAIYIRAVKLPVAYLPLAKGDSASFLLLEAIYDVLYVAGVVVGFHYAQLTGAGLAITIVGTIDWMVIVGYAYRKYSYRLDKSIFRYMALQLPIGLTAYLLTFTSSQWLYWSVGVLLVVLSTLVSLYLLRGKLPVIGRLWLKLRRRREP